MSYSMKTDIPWDRTRADLENSLWSWRAKDISISTQYERYADRHARIEMRKDVQWTPETRAVTVSFVHPQGRRITVTENRHARPADNLRVLFLCLDSMRKNEMRGFGEVLTTAYAQLSAPAEDNPYTILGVEPGASAEEVRAAYRRRSRAAHPDLGGSDEEMARVNRAYETVRNA